MEKGKEKKSSKKEKKDVKDKKSDRSKDKTLAGESDELTDKRSEPYICTGNFIVDFEEICQRNSVSVVPEIVPRAKWPSQSQPNNIVSIDSKVDKVKSPQKVTNQVPEAEIETVETPDDNGEAPPKTFILREGYEYFKPHIQIEMEVKEKPETVSEIYIRGWKVDEKYLKIFQKCWVSLEKLNLISLWDTGLDQDSIQTLASFLPKCSNLKKLYIDANYIKYSDYGILLQKNCNIQFLSLRHCKITDQSLYNITQAISDSEPCKLISLNLTGNFITDRGAKYLAHVLRKNRSLLNLGLANNQIGDEGAKAFAGVLSKFTLNDDEIFERRKLIMEKQIDDMKNPVICLPPEILLPPGRKSEMRDGSTVSLRTTASDKKEKRERGKGRKEIKSGKDFSVKDDEKGLKVKKDKEDKGNSAGTTPVSAVINQPPTSSSTPFATSQSSANLSSFGKKLSKEHSGKSTRSPTAQVSITKTSTEMEGITIMEHGHPLMGRVEYNSVNKELWVTGNKMLKCLDLSRNKITSNGIKELLDSMKKQSEQNITEQSGLFPGLLCLRIKKNLAPEKCPYVKELNELMAVRDPVRKLVKDENGN
ncbi:leucine-rich repeat-containing protein 71 isoform X1 [Octopus bimaculoides]|uniref:Leucine-rich repeat-containing protein 71 n=1 Tax=Octopus bimaculoides TaxID=37653 RepID=A0A0L8GSL7_OCTBM|nr:leucine-rich repeat-containing protein 71 isoform X1 [Octopus bimaculoides]